MEKVKLELHGTTPILMHDNKAANPLGRYSQALKPLTSKRNKTDQDFREIARLEWESGLYMNNGVVSMPARCLERCFWEGAKKSKNGVKYKSGAMVDDDFCDLSYKGSKIKVQTNGEIPNPDLDKYFSEHSHQDMVRVSGNQVLRTRPIFYDWKMNVSILFEESIIDKRTLVKCIEDAGRLTGLCEQRPRLGRFDVVEI